MFYEHVVPCLPGYVLHYAVNACGEQGAVLDLEEAGMKF